MKVAINEFVNGSIKGSQTVLSYVPGIGRLAGREAKSLDSKNLEEGVAKVENVSLEQISAPSTGAFGCIKGLGCCGGLLAGAALGTILVGLGSVEIWGVGAGLWDQGEKQDKEALITAGKIMVLYVGVPIIGLGTCIGGILGAVSGAAAAD